MSLANDLNDKFFQALCAGVVKHAFLGDAALGDDVLLEELFGDSSMPEAARSALLEAARGVFGEATAGAWNVARFEEYLESGTDASEAHRAVMARVWQAHGAAVHEAVVRRSRWGPGLEGIAWRIDVKTTTKDRAEVNEPTAIVELTLGGGAGAAAAAGGDGGGGDATVGFEMDQAEVKDMVEQLATIERHISNTA